jgi:glycosyltransferase involved in cell wall biosynthesis
MYAMANPEPIDVIMCTWNSNSAYFRRCLVSIKRDVAVNHFIAIDRFSSDGTLETVQSVFPNAKIIQTDANLAQARTVGIKYVDTRLFAFIDDDIEVSEGWFTSLVSLIRSGKQGAVQGVVRYRIDYLDKEQLFLLGRRKENVIEITDRGYTHNTILMTEIVRDFHPPPIIHSWEDFLMTQHIIGKGYRWLETDQAQVIHYRDFGKSYLNALWKYVLRAKWDAAGNRLVHLYSSSFGRQIAYLLSNSAKSILHCLITSIVIMDPRLLLFRVLGQFGYLRGFLSAEENAVPFELRTVLR